CSVIVSDPISVVTTYTITVENSRHGKVETFISNASKGVSITFFATPSPGYDLGLLTITDSQGNLLEWTDKGNGKYTFAMPAADVTIAASFIWEAPEGTLPFTDVTVEDWFYTAAAYAYDKEMMAGTQPTLFSPYVNLTRSMAAQI